MAINEYFRPIAAPVPVLKMAEICALLGRSRQTVYRWISEDELPLPLRTTTGRLIGWNRDEVMKYLNNKL